MLKKLDVHARCLRMFDDIIKCFLDDAVSLLYLGWRQALLQVVDLKLNIQTTGTAGISNELLQ